MQVFVVGVAGTLLCSRCPVGWWRLAGRPPAGRPAILDYTYSAHPSSSGLCTEELQWTLHIRTLVETLAAVQLEQTVLKSPKLDGMFWFQYTLLSTHLSYTFRPAFRLVRDPQGTAHHIRTYHAMPCLSKLARTAITSNTPFHEAPGSTSLQITGNTNISLT